MGFRGGAWGPTDGGSSTSSSIDCLTGTESLMDLVNGSILGTDAMTGSDSRVDTVAGSGSRDGGGSSLRCTVGADLGSVSVVGMGFVSGSTVKNISGQPGHSYLERAERWLLEVVLALGSQSCLPWRLPW